MCGVIDSLITEEKRPQEHKSDAKAITHHLLPADQCPARLGAAAALEKLPPNSLQNVPLCGMQYQSGQFRAAVPDVFPPPAYPQMAGGRPGKNKSQRRP